MHCLIGYWYNCLQLWVPRLSCNPGAAYAPISPIYSNTPWHYTIVHVYSNMHELVHVNKCTCVHEWAYPHNNFLDVMIILLKAINITESHFCSWTISRVHDRRRASNCTIIAAATAQIVSKSQTGLLSVHSKSPIFKFCANWLYKLIEVWQRTLVATPHNN